MISYDVKKTNIFSEKIKKQKKSYKNWLSKKQHKKEKLIMILETLEWLIFFKKKTDW